MLPGNWNQVTKWACGHKKAPFCFCPDHVTLVLQEGKVENMICFICTGTGWSLWPRVKAMPKVCSRVDEHQTGRWKEPGGRIRVTTFCLHMSWEDTTDVTTRPRPMVCQQRSQWSEKETALCALDSEGPMAQFCPTVVSGHRLARAGVSQWDHVQPSSPSSGLSNALVRPLHPYNVPSTMLSSL